MNKLFSFIERSLIKWIGLSRDLPLQIDITNACNLKCKHCYHPHHNNRGALSLNDWINVIYQYESLIMKFNYSRSILICGGEPFLSPLLLPILKLLLTISSEYKITLLTNGTLLNKVNSEIFSILQQFKSVSFQVSIDGPDAERHDSIRGDGSFNASIAGINFLKEYGFKIYLLSVLSRKTKSWIEDSFKLAADLKVSSISFTRFISEGQGKIAVQNKEDNPLYSLDLKSAFEDVIKYSAIHKVKTCTNIPLFRLIHKGLGRNGRFSEGLVVDYRGNILASSRSRLILGHVLHDGLETFFLNNVIFKKIRKNNISKCGNCKFIKVCGGDRNAAYAASGDYLGEDPGCWLDDNYQDISLKIKESFIKQTNPILS